jgi:hypothetical protein
MNKQLSALKNDLTASEALIAPLDNDSITPKQRSLGNTNLLTNDEIINSQETVSIPLLYYNLYSRYTYF